MRSGKLRLVGLAVAAIAFVSAGCDRSPGGGDWARTETGTQADPGSATPAPGKGATGGAVGAATAARPKTATTAPATPEVDTAPPSCPSGRGRR